jgi:hypothetical protein
LWQQENGGVGEAPNFPGLTLIFCLEKCMHDDDDDCESKKDNINNSSIPF